jgi:hypothetical protein
LAPTHQSKDAEHSHHKAGRDFRYGVNKDTDLLNGGTSGNSEASDHRPERAISDRDSHDWDGSAGEYTSGDTSKNINYEAVEQTEEESHMDEDKDADKDEDADKDKDADEDKDADKDEDADEDKDADKDKDVDKDEDADEDEDTDEDEDDGKHAQRVSRNVSSP